MKKILLYIDKTECRDRDIYRISDYSNQMRKELFSDGFNSGNKVWLSAVEQYLTSDDINYSYLNQEMTADYINRHFDLVVFPCANRLRNDTAAKKDLQQWTIIFRQLNIPVLILGIGAQADNFNQLDAFTADMKDFIGPFCDAVKSTEGVIAVRGDFTNNILQRCGYNDAVTIGCPSLYRNGPDFKIFKNTTLEFKPVLNIQIRDFYQDNIIKEVLNNANCQAIDQNDFYDLLYTPECIKNLCEKNGFKFDLEISKYSYSAVKMISEERLHLFYDEPIWRKYLIDNEFTFSYGSRIHGTIMAILAGIPAVLFNCDSRTREIAEYMGIPIYENKTMPLDQIYDKVDYSEFNTKYPANYEKFRHLLQRYGINISEENIRNYRQKASQVDYIFPPSIDGILLGKLADKLSSTMTVRRSYWFGQLYRALKKGK